jgi:serine/threonine protein kinase
VRAPFGPFVLLASIATGGMGETFLAERTGPEGVVQRVCVKRVLPADAGDPLWKRMFLDEARIVATLRHSNIVSLIEFGLELDAWWMSLELIEGADLFTVFTALRAAGRRLPVEVVLFIAAELAKALSYAYTTARVVHRDVTPSNILLSYTGSVKLADFGIAKDAKTERTRTGQQKGKVPYMSPEHSLQRPLDGRSDLLWLGVVLFELLAGQRPFEGATELVTQTNTVQGIRKDLRALAPEVPEAVVKIVEHLTESEPDARTASADDLLDELSAIAVPANVVRTLGKQVTECRPPTVVPSEGLLSPLEVTVLTRRYARPPR